ncbi:MAG TPA: hypothetical protein VFB60_08040 [Ktedonobacteraceae bacterium]|nr:hypothetical protein [Ktedonobacteraceae bacterium]
MKRRVLSTFVLVMALFVFGANTYVLIAPLVLGPNAYHDNPYFSFIRWASTGVLLIVIAIEWRYRWPGKTILDVFSTRTIVLVIIITVVLLLIGVLVALLVTPGTQ